MPWQPTDAIRHNKGANTPEKQKLWAEVANADLALHGDEGRAARTANSTLKHRSSPVHPQMHTVKAVAYNKFPNFGKRK